MKRVLLLSFLFGFEAFAANSQVLTCERDSHLHTLRIEVGRAPVGGYVAMIDSGVSGEQSRFDRVRKDWPDRLGPVALDGRIVTMRIPVGSPTDLPPDQIRISYKLQSWPSVTAVCKKGPAYNSLFY